MGNEIVDGVSNAINAVFGDCDIYQNDVTQGFSEPCFFIALLQETRQAYPNGRASRQYLLDISYFPEDGGDNRTMAAVSEELLDALSMIKLQDGSFLRGTNLSAFTATSLPKAAVIANLSNAPPMIRFDT